MKVDFDVNKIFDEYASQYTHELNDYVMSIKDEVDSRTPELTMELIEHNNVELSSGDGTVLTWSVFNDLGGYAEDVEEGMGSRMQYHKYPEGSTAIYNEPPPPSEDIREVIAVWDGAKMFEWAFEYMDDETDIFNSIFTG